MIVAGFLTPLEDILRSVLVFFHDSANLPWAWSIVALTIVVRILLVPLTVKQIHSMQRLQAHAPEMKEIQRKFKGDKQRMNEELMKFYRDNKINPAASCLPLLAQFPVFIALFFVLRNFTKHVPDATSLGWLHVVPDITKAASSHWSGYMLITIYVISQIASTYFMSTTMQQSQRILMMVLPVFFVAFIINFPTGLVLYWVTTNLWTVGQGLITRRLVPKKPPAPPKRSSRTPPSGGPPPDGGKPERPQPAGPSGGPTRVKRKKKKKAKR
jgi:YidC/Oxa1 family membrane protein insertase